MLIYCASQGAAETRQMRATIRIVNSVCVAENLIVVTVVVLHYDIDMNLDTFVIQVLRSLLTKRNRLGVQGLAILVKLFYELLNAVLEVKSLGFRSSLALVGE